MLQSGEDDKWEISQSARNSFQAVAEVCPETFAMLATEKDKTNTQLPDKKASIYIYRPCPHHISRTMAVGRNALYAV